MNARTLDAAAAAHSVLVNTHRSPHEPRPAVPRLTLVACVASKQPGTHRAADLYTSPWFRKARAYVEQRGNPWLILSAEHGLLYPWQWVDSYDRTLTGQRAATRRSWAARVRGLFVSEYGSGSVGTLELLAGVTYRQYLAPELAPFVGEIAVPMAGLGIGSQLQWLTRAVEAGA